jgi:hypothetical protein
MSARTVGTVILACVLAGCGAGSAPLQSPVTPAIGAVITPAPTGPGAALLPPSPTPIATARPTPKPTPKPAPKPTPKPVPVPPRPTGVTFHEDTDCLDTECGRAKTTQTVIWKTPRTKGVEIRVYGVTECLAEPAHPKPATNGPCLVAHTPLPSSVRTLLARAPASDGWVSWSWKHETGCEVGLSNDPDGPSYVAIVVAAYSTSGHSIFAIADPGGWFRLGPDEQVC